MSSVLSEVGFDHQGQKVKALKINSSVGDVVIAADGKFYHYDSINNKLGNAVRNTNNTLHKEISNAALAEIETNAAGLSDKSKALIQHHVASGHFDVYSKGEASLKKVRDAVTRTGNIAKNPRNHKLIGESYLKNSLTRDLETIKQGEAIVAGGFKDALLTSFSEARAELRGLLDPATANAKDIETFFANNHENSDRLLETITGEERLALRRGGVDIDINKIARETKKTIQDGFNRAKPLAETVIRDAKALATENAKSTPNAKLVASLEERLAKSTENYKKALEGDHGGAISKAVLGHGTISKDMEKHAPDLLTHTEGAAATAAKAAKDGTWFTKSAEELKKTAKEGKKEVKDLGKWARRTTGGKVAIVVGTAAALAGIAKITGVFSGGVSDRARPDDRVLASQQEREGPARA